MKISNASVIAFCAYCLAGSALGQIITLAGYNDTNCAVLGNPTSQSIPHPSVFPQNVCSKIFRFPDGTELYALANCATVSSVFQVRTLFYLNSGCTTYLSANVNASGLCQTVDPPPPYGSFKFSCTAHKLYFPISACAACDITSLLAVFAALAFCI
jgi:hypothetical protein